MPLRSQDINSPKGSAAVPLTQGSEQATRNIARSEKAPCDHIWIPGGTFMMGSDHHYPEEAPAHEVSVDGFWIDRHPVTNDEFSRFVHDSVYVTVAERIPNPADYPGAKLEMLIPASVVFRKPKWRVDLNNHLNWWTYVPGANWRHPEGPRSTLKGKARHPVVHIAYEDAAAYAAWAGKELPSEADWEFAARGGLQLADYAWGNTFMPNGLIMANTWHGEFPYFNLATHGYEGTSPVGAFTPNGYGLSDMIGNVWEWTNDWYEARHKSSSGCCSALHNPNGGDREESFDPRAPQIKIPRKVTKGGSYLCAPNYCRRYRPAARMAQPVDTSTCHLGFRCVVHASDAQH
jgi:formylglycine-generating enzyme required for sulfatase activity